MNNFTIIYKILRKLETAMGLDEFSLGSFDLAALQCSQLQFVRILEMLKDRGYIDGVSIKRSVDGDMTVSDAGIRITLSGLEYLHTNELMLRAADAAKGNL